MMDETAAPTLTSDEVNTLKEVAANYEAAKAGDHIPVEIPSSDTRPPASVWAAGDVHHTHEQVYEESPAGVQAASAPDPRDAEIIRLNAIIAGTSKDPNYVAPEADPRDAEIARLQALVNGVPAPADAPVEVQAATVDPRDAEIARLQAELDAKSETDPAAPAASPAAAGDAAPA